MSDQFTGGDNDDDWVDSPNAGKLAAGDGDVAQTDEHPLWGIMGDEAVVLTDELMDSVDDAIEMAMSQHEETTDERGWQVCTCGARNNMDGDVLFSHRISAVMDAVHQALGLT